MSTPTCKVNAADPSKNMCLVCLADANCTTTKPSCYKDPGMDDTKTTASSARPTNCKSPTSLCYVDADPKKNACTVCLANADCKSPTATLCYVDATDKHLNVCTQCLANARLQRRQQVLPDGDGNAGQKPLCAVRRQRRLFGQDKQVLRRHDDPANTVCVECLANMDFNKSQDVRHGHPTCK